MEKIFALWSLLNTSAITSCVLMLGYLLGGSPAAFGQQYPFIPVPGSPKGVSSLFEDSKGRLWLGGRQSACFDGARFFPLSDYGLPAGDANVFSEDTSGVIWVGTDTGIYQFVNGRMEEISNVGAQSLVAVTSDIAVAVLGRYLPASAPIVRIVRTRNGWKIETVTGLVSSGRLTLDASGTLLYPTPGEGWSEVGREDLEHWQPGDNMPVTRHPIVNFPADMTVMRDHSGCVWWSGGDRDAGYDCGRGPQVAPTKGVNLRSRIHEATDGSIVLMGGSLLLIGRPGTFQIASPANGMPSVVDAIKARDGTVWVATLVGGLYRFAAPFRIEYWTIRDGVTDTPWAITRSGDRVYAGMNKRIVVLRNDRSRWETVTVFNDGALVSGLLGADDGTLMAGIKNDGAVQLSRQGNVFAKTEKEHPPGVMRFARIPDGETWLGQTRLGRIRRVGKVLQFEDHPLRTQPSRTILAIKYETVTRRLWACYNGGLVERDEHGVWKEFTTRDGLLANDCWSLAPLPNGDLWYSYFDVYGIALVRPRPDGGLTVRQYRLEDGLKDPRALTFERDQRGWLWRGGAAAVNVANQTEAEAGNWLQLDELDGFPAGGMNSGSAFVDEDQSLWLGADNDLVHYAPAPDLVTPQFSPQIVVSAFSWEGRAPRLAEASSDFPHDANVVGHIGSLQFTHRNGLRLRFRILPEHPAWREANSLDLPLGSLSSGSHALEVQGRVFTGPWSPSRTRTFTVLPSVWLAPRAFFFYLLITALLGSGAYLLYRRRQAVDAELLPDLAAWRLGALLPDVRELEGTLIGSCFEVGQLLARGGFANVMNGYDRDRRQRCAVKVFRSEVKDKAWIQRRFEEEVTALQRIRHPNVVKIYAHGTTSSGAQYLVMEFIEGKNLREVLDGGPISRRRTARLLRQLAEALDAIHAERIWHRDVKPENIIIRNEGDPKEEAVLIDFSIAIVQDANETLYGLSRAAGSFDYMAPEQTSGYAEASSDVYSLSKVAIEMLAGGRVSHLLPKVYLELPDRVRELLCNLPFKLSQDSINTLARALELDPRKRPSVAKDLIDPLALDLESDTLVPGE